MRAAGGLLALALVSFATAAAAQPAPMFGALPLPLFGPPPVAGFAFEQRPPSEPPPLRRLDGSTIEVAELDQFIVEQMQARSVTGLGVAILQGGEVAYLRTFGERDAWRHLPMTPDTVMYGASLSKAMFGALVASLADEGVLDLDRPIIEYLGRWGDVSRFTDLGYDLRANRITSRMLMNHTAGLANMRQLERGGRVRIHFNPGAYYAYSNEGIHLMQAVVEAVTGRSADALMRERIFAPLGMAHTSLTWQPQHAGDTANGYNRWGRSYGHTQRPAPRVAGSIDTTLADTARFVSAVVRGTLISPSAKQRMLAPTIAIRSARQFPTLDISPVHDNDAIGLAYGIGWGLLTTTPYGLGYFKEGHDDGWANYTLAFDRDGIAIVLMTNSDNGERVFRPILEKAIHDDVTPWSWEGYP